MRYFCNSPFFRRSACVNLKNWMRYVKYSNFVAFCSLASALIGKRDNWSKMYSGYLEQKTICLPHWKFFNNNNFENELKRHSCKTSKNYDLLAGCPPFTDDISIHLYKLMHMFQYDLFLTRGNDFLIKEILFCSSLYCYFGYTLNILKPKIQKVNVLNRKVKRYCVLDHRVVPWWQPWCLLVESLNPLENLK